MKLTVTVNGTAYDVEVEVEPEPPPSLPGFTARLAQSLHPPTHVKAPAEEHKVLRATISGTVTQVLVRAGDAVSAGDTLLVLEAMKMESEITAPADGTIAEVAVAEGEAVTGGQILVQWR